jgi:hypothetical protein
LIQAIVQLKKPIMNVAQRLDPFGQRDGQDHHRCLPLITSEARYNGDRRQANERQGDTEPQILAEGIQASCVSCLHGPEMKVGKH